MLKYDSQKIFFESSSRPACFLIVDTDGRSQKKTGNKLKIFYKIIFCSLAKILNWY